MEDRINCLKRMLADNPYTPAGLLALVSEYGKAERYVGEAAAATPSKRHEDQQNIYVDLPAPCRQVPLAPTKWVTPEEM